MPLPGMVPRLWRCGRRRAWCRRGRWSPPRRRRSPPGGPQRRGFRPACTGEFRAPTELSEGGYLLISPQPIAVRESARAAKGVTVTHFRSLAAMSSSGSPPEAGRISPLHSRGGGAAGKTIAKSFHTGESASTRLSRESGNPQFQPPLLRGRLLECCHLRGRRRESNNFAIVLGAAGLGLPHLNSDVGYAKGL